MITTATEYAKVYEDAFVNGGLTQGSFHTERDGRQLACALGVIGPEIDEPEDCPASIMPGWLAQMVPAFFDNQRQEDAFTWGKGFTAELARLDGNVPFSVVHDWHANAVCVLGIRAAALRKRDTEPHIALQALHFRALAGEKISEEEWRPVLRNTNAYAYAYANAYAYAYAYACADAYAYAYAYADAYACADANAWKRLADGMTAALSRVAVS